MKWVCSPYKTATNPLFIGLCATLYPLKSCTESVSFLYFTLDFGFLLPIYTVCLGKSFEYPVIPETNIQFE